MTSVLIVVCNSALGYLLHCAHQPVAVCGAIVTSRSDGHCASDTFESELDNCLDCSLKHEIWQYYGGSVFKAASARSLEANPVEVASAVAGTTSATSETTVADQRASGESVNISFTKAKATASLTARSPSQPAPSPYSTAKANLSIVNHYCDYFVNKHYFPTRRKCLERTGLISSVLDYVYDKDSLM